MNGYDWEWYSVGVCRWDVENWDNSRKKDEGEEKEEKKWCGVGYYFG